MQQFSAKNLEEAYEKATSELNCSITELDIEIIQSGSKGILGFFSQNTVILAGLKSTNAQAKKDNNKKSNKKQKTAPVTKILQLEESEEKIFDDFYSSKDVKEVHSSITVKKDEKLIIEDIETKINDLFALTCYKLEKIKVCFYDEQTIYIAFDGEDAALLIGKEGYRYKALSYILFNWIHEKYKLMVRLEVSKFLQTQEEAIYAYLVPVIETIKEEGSFKTKPLDGVLVHIALTKLRDEFPNKYVAVKTNVKGDKYILVNEYRK